VAVPEGTFRLYSRIEPPLEAGTWRLRAEQDLSATRNGAALGPAALPVDSHDTHLQVRCPRFTLPPDQVLSTFPPAMAVGSFGSRLPQVVLRRRTLPWERLPGPSLRGTPWLALVLIAEGEGELRTNRPVAECVTPGVVLAGEADAPRGSCLAVRRSMVHEVFPTQKDVPLLAHAREVDISDTELMMGDDDGFLAVVISNRLPLPDARDRADAPVPTRYLACLVNLEGQFASLLPEAPPPAPRTELPLHQAALHVQSAGWDHLVMGRTPTAATPGRGGTRDAPTGEAPTGRQRVAGVPVTTPAPFHRAGQYAAAGGATGADVYVEMARGFTHVSPHATAVLDPLLVFPVLLHWSFTSAGATTFRSLMETLHSGLLGTLPPPTQDGRDAAAPAGRLPLEAVETGHVGLPHRTRRGDQVRAWYRGPLVPHPTADPPEGRLPLAHASDQLRIVVPDGREDLSLATAFEIGRLLALSHPALVAALLRWRQVQYAVQRRSVVWSSASPLLEAVLGGAGQVTADLGRDLGRSLVERLAAAPEAVLGAPLPVATQGRPLELGRQLAGTAALDLLAAGFDLPPDVLSGRFAAVAEELAARPVVLAPDLGVQVGSQVTAGLLRTALDRRLADLVSDTLAPQLPTDLRLGPTVPRTAVTPPRPQRSGERDAVDDLVDALDGERDDGEDA
jgi:hypothetical protein